MYGDRSGRVDPPGVRILALPAGTPCRVGLRDLFQRAFETGPLFAEEGRSRIVRGGEMRVDRRELEIGARQQRRQRSPQVVEPESEPVHAGVDFQVIPQPLLVLLRRGLHGARGARRGNGRREPAVEQAVEVADAERAEHEDLCPHAGLAQRVPFFDVGAGQQIGARILERQRHLRGAVSVRVGLHHRNHAGAPARRPRSRDGRRYGDSSI